MSATPNHETLIDLVNRQTAASAALTRASTFSAMAFAISSNMLRAGGQFVSINVAEFDDDGALKHVRTIASANRHKATELTPPVEWAEPGYPVDDVIIGGRIVYIADGAAEPDVNEQFRQQLAAQGIHSVALLPLHHAGRSFGAIAINGTQEPLGLDEVELKLYQGLADQVAALIHVHHLTAESARSTEISEREARAFAELRGDMDFADMALVLARNMLPDHGRFLALSRFLHDSQNEVTGWQTLATANRDHTYRWDDGEIISLDDAGNALFQAIQNGDLYVINDLQPSHLQDLGSKMWSQFQKQQVRTFVNVPIRVQGQLVASMAVLSRQPNAFSREEINAFSNLTGQIGVLIQARTLLEEAQQSREVVNDLVLASRMISAANDYQDMAQAIIYTVAQQGVAVGISLFDRVLDAQNTPQSRLMVAVGTPEGPSKLDRSMNFDPIWNNVQLENLQRGIPVIVQDVPTAEAFFSAGTRQMLAGHDARWSISFGLRAGDQLLGTLDILHSRGYALSAEERDAFTTLADQIGLAIRSRQLLDESRTTQVLASQLVQTNRRISLADRYEEVARAVIEVMPEAVAAVAVGIFDRPVLPDERPLHLDTRVIASRSAVSQMQIADQLTPDAGLDATLRQLRDGEMITLQTAGEQSVSFAPIGLSLLQAQGGMNIALMGLRVGTRLLGVLAFGSDRPLTATRLQTDNFRAIADQVAITVENRNLINQTADALNFVQTQFEATSAVYSAVYPLEVLSAIASFAGSSYKHAHLGLIDSNPEMVRIVCELNHGQSNVNERLVRLDSYPASETLAALETLYIPDVANDTFLMDEERQRLLSQDISGLLIVPLVTGENLVGLIVFMSPMPTDLPPNRLRALRNLADQAALVFQNRALLGSTGEALDETRTLYEVSRAILSAQDTLDILRAVRRYLAPEADSITHLRMVYDAHERLSDIIVDHNLTSDTESIVEMSLGAMVGPEVIAATDEYHRANIHSTVDANEDLAQPSGTPHPLAALSVASGMRSSLTIPVYEGGLIREAISASFPLPQRFSERQLRIFEAVSEQISIVLQNHRLLREAMILAQRLSQQVDVLQSLNKLSTSIGQMQDEQELLDYSARMIVQVSGTEHCGLMLLDPSGEYGIVAAEYPNSGARGTRLNMNDNPLWDELIRGSYKPVLVEDVETDPRLEAGTRTAFKGIGLRSVGIMPLFANGKLIGSVGVDSFNASQPVTPQKLALAETVAAQINIGLQNVRLLSDARHRAVQLQRITTFGQSMQATLDLTTIFNIALTETSQLLPLTEMSIALYDQTRQELRTVARVSDGATSLSLTSGDIIPITGSVARVWQSWESVHVPDLRDVAEDLDPGVTLRSWVMAPILSRGRILGVASAGHVRPYAYTDTDIALFNQMIAQLAVAIENTEIFQQSQRVAKNEALINDISMQLQRQMDIHSMLDVTVNELGRVLGARRGRIRLSVDDTETLNSGTE
ncbi:MAG: GAF domain-containing protein [Anaerolineae bacterium]|nr:GAF domain-containing protein [Anaerolineae bacterium]